MCLSFIGSSQAGFLDTSSTSTEPISDSASSSESINWSYNYEVPWNQFSKEVLNSFKNEEFIFDGPRREMVRNLIMDITKITARPKRKDLERVAFSIIQKYPKSFEVYADDLLLTDGLKDLTNQLENRVDNINRASKKRLREEFYNKTAETALEVETPSVEVLDEWKKQLDNASRQQSPNQKEVLQLMKKTFQIQQEDIRKSLSITEIKKKWPFLFNVDCFSQYYSIVIKKENALKELLNSIALKSGNLYK